MNKEIERLTKELNEARITASQALRCAKLMGGYGIDDPEIIRLEGIIKSWGNIGIAHLPMSRYMPVDKT